MAEKSQLELIFDEWEVIIANIMKNWTDWALHQQLIQTKTKFIVALGKARKDLKDKRLTQKVSDDSDTKKNIEDWMAKTPARDLVNELSRASRYELEKLDIDMETMQSLIQNRTYHIRYGEIDLNKNWIPLSQ